MTLEHDTHFFSTIDEAASSLVEDFHSIVAQLAIQEEDELASYIRSLLQQYGFLPQFRGEHIICETNAIKGTKTLLLFSSCPPQKNVFARWEALVTRLLTFALYHKTIGSIPIKIVWLIDFGVHGKEDEKPQWLASHAAVMQADGCLYDIEYEATLPVPCLALGTKGLLRIEVGVKTASSEQHVSHGAILPNAAWRLTWALNSLKDAREDIQIEGFYDTLVPIEDEEIALLQAMLPHERALKERLNVDEFLLQLQGFQLYYTYLLLPTCTITSMHSGYTAASSQTLPSTAYASIDIQIVPEQEPEDILYKLRKHLDARGFQDVYVKVLARRRPQHTLLREDFVKGVYESASMLYRDDLSVLPLLPSSEAYYPLQSLLNIPVVYAQLTYMRNELYEHDTVASEARLWTSLIQGMKHMAMIIEVMNHTPDEQI